MSRRSDYLTRLSRTRRALSEPHMQAVLACSGFECVTEPTPLAKPERCKGCGASDVENDGYCRWCDRGAS